MSTTDELAPPIRVHVASMDASAQLGPAPAGGKRKRRGVYTTVVLTANDPVQNLLPEDPARVSAWIITLDHYIVIGTYTQVQAAQNSAASVPMPIGAYLPVTTNPVIIHDTNAVFGGITQAANTRVTVAAFYED